MSKDDDPRTPIPEAEQPIDPALSPAMNAIADALNEHFSALGCGFTLLVFPMDSSDGRMNYISTAERESMTVGLKELVARLAADDVGLQAAPVLHVLARRGLRPVENLHYRSAGHHAFRSVNKYHSERRRIGLERYDAAGAAEEARERRCQKQYRQRSHT